MCRPVVTDGISESFVMLHFSTGSSELPIIITPQQPAPAVLDKLAELSVDEPLPETYAADRIRLLAQSPRKLYLYWELARSPFETLRRAFGSRAGDYTLVVKLTDLRTNSETLYLASTTRAQWFDAQPGHAYRADLGLYARGRAFIRLLSSAKSETPRAGVSRRGDHEPEFRVSADEFARVLDNAGYVSDALEVSLEAADQATGNAATRAVARQFGGVDAPALTEEELAELRELVAAVAFGMTIEDARSVVSARLARWLEDASRLRKEELDALHLLEILRATLGIETDQTALGFLNEAAMRRNARFFVGASEVNLPLKPFHLWMPSMTQARIKAEG